MRRENTSCASTNDPESSCCSNQIWGTTWPRACGAAWWRAVRQLGLCWVWAFGIPWSWMKLRESERVRKGFANECEYRITLPVLWPCFRLWRGSEADGLCRRPPGVRLCGKKGGVGWWASRIAKKVQFSTGI
jgi:hypothetical protein